MKTSRLIATLMALTLLLSCSETLQLSPINERILLRYRSDAVKNNPNILSKFEEKNVESFDYPSSSSEFIFRVAWLNGLSSYIKVENFDIETFDARLAKGLTIEAWFSPEDVTGQRPLFWYEDAFLLTIDDGKLVGKVKATNFDEFLTIQSDTAIIEPDKWYFVAFRDSLNVSQPPDLIHHLDLWVNHQKITSNTATVPGGFIKARNLIQGRPALSAIGAYREVIKKKERTHLFRGKIMAVEVKNYPADTRYLALPTPNDGSIYWGRPTYLDDELKVGIIPEKRILESFLPHVQPLLFVPFQNMSYVPCGLTTTKGWEREPQINRLYLALSWKDTTENKTERPSIIAEMVIEEEGLHLQRYFYLSDELQDHRISGIAYFKNLSEEYLFILSAEKDPEAGYQILGQYELRKTRHFANPFWPKRFWKIRLDAMANDAMGGGQAWMSCEKKGTDEYILWIGSFTHIKEPGLTPDSSEVAQLYQFLLTHRGNLLDPLTKKEVVVSGSKVTYQKAWELPVYKKDSTFCDINGGAWYYQGEQKYFIFAIGYGDEINYLKKYPFDEESGFGECQSCLPVPAGTREIDLISGNQIVSVSASGCYYLQNKQQPHVWTRTCFPFIFSVKLSDVSQKCP